MTTATTNEKIILEDPVGPQEIAERLGVTVATVHSWRHRAGNYTHRAGLPAEEITRSNVPLWSWARIAEWAKATGRLA